MAIRNKCVMKILIDAGADVNLQNNCHETAMDLILCPYFLKKKKTKATIIELLIMAGADINTTNQISGKSVFHDAVDSGNIKLVKFLISQGADINEKKMYKYKGNKTALQLAADKIISNSSYKLIKLLLEAKAEVDPQSREEDTPLYILLKRNESTNPASELLCKYIELFIKHGAYIDSQSSLTSIMIHAIQNLKLEVVNALLLAGKFDVNNDEYTTNFGPILNSYFLDYSIIKALLKKGANIDALDRDNVSCLRNLIITLIKNYNYHGEVDDNILKYFLKYNPDVNTITPEGDNIMTEIDDEDVNLDDIDQLPIVIKKIILEFLAKLQQADKPLHPNLLETINNNSKYKNYFAMCNEELELLQNCEIHPDSRFTLFNVLINDKSKPPHYGINVDLTINLLSSPVFENFPIYGSTIRQKLLKRVEKLSILNQAEISVSRLVSVNIDSKHCVVDEILSFFKKKDLEDFVWNSDLLFD